MSEYDVLAAIKTLLSSIQTTYIGIPPTPAKVPYITITLIPSAANGYFFSGAINYMTIQVSQFYGMSGDTAISEALDDNLEIQRVLDRSKLSGLSLGMRRLTSPGTQIEEKRILHMIQMWECQTIETYPLPALATTTAP